MKQSYVLTIRNVAIAQHKSTIEMCMANIDAHIKHSPLPGNGCDESAERNGLVLAYNILSEMLDREEGDTIKDAPT